MNMKTKVISISIAVMMFIAMAAISVTAVSAVETTTVAATDATSSTQAAATNDSATSDSTVDSANGSIPTGDSNAALWAAAVVIAIVGVTGVTCFAHARKKS